MYSVIGWRLTVSRRNPGHRHDDHRRMEQRRPGDARTSQVLRLRSASRREALGPRSLWRLLQRDGEDIGTGEGTLMNIKHHIGFWEDHSPSRSDALLYLYRALNLLSDALPLALQEIGNQALEVQENFWRSYLDFDREADFDLHLLGSDGSTKAEALAMLFVDWAEVTHLRISKRTGSLNEPKENPEASEQGSG